MPADGASNSRCTGTARCCTRTGTGSATAVCRISFPERIFGESRTRQHLGLARGQFGPDTNTIFDLASVSKEFTAGAILLLQQDGKLSVNDPLSKYFPSIPMPVAIPLLYLLQHRSGLVEYNNFGDFPDFSGAYASFMTGGQTNYAPIADRLASFPLNFAPGSQFDYSNSNYLLLGMIVAKVSGEPFGAFMQQRIFDPLGMAQTHQGYPPRPVSDFALGYEPTAARSTARRSGTSPGSPARRTTRCSATSSLGPRSPQWGSSPRTRLGRCSRRARSRSRTARTSDGWFIATLDGHRYIWHDGAFGGFQAKNARIPGTTASTSSS